VCDEDLGTQLLPTIRGLLGNQDKLQAMGAAARGLSRPEAAQMIAAEIERAAARGAKAHG
jgi:UDP-N-acetylglucosamine:LPS N-acetylglucosamine transferase